MAQNNPARSFGEYLSKVSGTQLARKQELEQAQNKLKIELLKDKINRDENFANDMMKKLQDDQLTRSRQREQQAGQLAGRKEMVDYSLQSREQAQDRGIAEWTKLGERRKALQEQGRDLDPLSLGRYNVLNKKYAPVSDKQEQSYLQKKGADENVMGVASRIKTDKDIIGVLSNKEHFQKTLGFEQYKKLLDYIDENIIPTLSDDQLQKLVEAGLIESEE
jgi:hypothetical protein